MKKIVVIILPLLLFSACGFYKNLDLSKLTTGMTKAQVRAVIGEPYRVLAVNNTSDGYQEVLEYRTAYNEVYALEFWNDYLTGYEFLYDDVDYITPSEPPMYRPEYGRPIYVYPPGNNKPNRPNRPDRPQRPSRPGNTTGPETPSRPSQSRPETRPTLTPETRPSARPSTSTSGQVDRSGLAK